MKKYLNRLMAFIVRDVRSFFFSSSDNEQHSNPCTFSPDEQITLSATDISENTTEAAEFIPLPLFLNPVALDRVAFRREIRDWRDNSILQLSLAAKEALDEFSIHVETLLDDVSSALAHSLTNSFLSQSSELLRPEHIRKTLGNAFAQAFHV